MDIVIIFIGLMSHITQPVTGGQQPRQIVVLVEASGHVSELIVPSKAEIPTSHKKLFPAFGSNPRTNGDNHYDIKGLSIEILGLPVGAKTTLEPAFRDFVPSLQKVSDGTKLHPSVEKEEVGKANIRSIIALSGGKLDVANYYEYEDKNFNYGPKCVAEQVKFTEKISGTAIELVSNAGHRLRIAGNTTITIRNLPRTTAMPAHYKNKKDLLSNASTMKDWEQKHLVNCRQTPTNPPVKFADTDCSNSQFP